MILRPVRPVSPCGPPITNLPVGLMKYFVSDVKSSAGTTGLITFSMRSCLICSKVTSGSC